VTTGLNRFYGNHDLHFITGSCYRRQPELGTARRRDLFLQVLEQARRRCQFVVYGYVVMPEHFHLLMSEPERGDPSAVMKVVKQRFTRLVHGKRKQPSAAQATLWIFPRTRVWQKRFYDFNVWSTRKRIEKLRYMHRNLRGPQREPTLLSLG
jgi:putative transposase